MCQSTVVRKHHPQGNFVNSSTDSTSKNKRYWPRLVIAVLLILLFAVILRFPHTFRAIFRRPVDAGAPGAQLVASRYTGNVRAVPGDCLPAWDTVTEGDYVQYLDSRTYDLDPQGVLLQNYFETFDLAQWQYQPYSIGQFGMVGMQAWCQHNDPIGLEIAIKQADWLLANARYQPHAVWLYDFPNDGFSAPAGWWSGFSSAFDIALLVQVYSVTQERRYLDMATSALEAYTLPVEQGGMQAIMPDNVSVFFEEVAHPQSPPSHILNGHMFALFGLAYYGDHIGGELAPQLVDLGIGAVRNTMHLYDAGDRTNYSLNPLIPKPVTHYAHGIHVRGLRWIAERTGDPLFAVTADLWAAMDGTEW